MCGGWRRSKLDGESTSESGDRNDRRATLRSLSKEARQILFLPRLRTPEPAKFSLPAIELLMVHEPTAVRIVLIRHDRMKHLVINDVLQKPRWDERAIQQRMNPNDSVIFLNRAENDVILRAELALSPPDDRVSLQPIPEILGVQLFEDGSQIEKPALLSKRKLPLHRQDRAGNFSLPGGHTSGSGLRLRDRSG